VLPHARGRGLSRAAIIEALRPAATHGCRAAPLQVDSENVTGALGLYERLGFATEPTLTTWSRSLDRLH
jgi:mycothiol synthase